MKPRSIWMTLAMLLLVQVPVGVLMNQSTIVAQAQTPSALKTEADRLFQQGDQQFQANQYDRALKIFQQAFEQYRRIGDRQRQAIALLMVGRCHNTQGRGAEALQAYQSSLALFRSGNIRPGQGVTLNNIGTVYKNQGQYSQALNFYNQALAIQKDINDRFGQGITFNNIGTVYNDQGQYSQALNFYNQALAIQKDNNDRFGQGITLNNIGNVYGAQGQYPQALNFYSQALTIAKQVNDRQGEAAALNNIGLIYDAQREYPQALNFYTQASVIQKDINARQGEAATLNNIGSVYRAQGQYLQALNFYNQALVIRKAANDRLGEAATLNNIGLIYNAQGQYPQALNFYNQALVITKKISVRSAEATTLSNIGAALVQQGQYNAAEKPLLGAIDRFESLRPGLTDSAKISFADLVRPHKWLQMALIAQNKTDAALQISERGRTRALVELMATRLATDPNQTEFIQKLSQPLQISQIQQVAKQQNATLVEYSTTNKELYIWVISPDGQIQFRKTPYKPLTIAISDLITTRRGTIVSRSEESWIVPNKDAKPNPNLDPKAQLQQLHKQLIDPIADLLPKNENDRVIFVPQGALFFVPFPALIDANGKYLIEKHTIQTVSSIQALGLAREQRLRPRNTSINALIIGNPTMPKLKTGSLAPLKQAEQEARDIAKLFNTQALIGQKATKTEVLKRIASARMIHFATHGLLDTVKGDIPGAIALAPTNPNQPEDGLLTANEIFDLKLNAELVVLSACDTAKGDLSGDGVVGLSRSLIAAGVPSIVVSLWSVDDRSTAVLMKLFYQNLGKMDRAQALRQAMLTTMKEYRHPYYWAAFTLIGKAQ